MTSAIRVTVLAILIGCAAGFLFPAHRSSATHIWLSLSVNPGASSTLTCGWHDTCLSGLYGSLSGLDWRNLGTQPPVYFRSWGVRTDGATENIARGWVFTANTQNCYRIRVYVDDVWGFPKGDIYYTHTRTGHANWTAFWIVGGPPISGTFTSYAAGWSVASELDSDCDFGGQHLHQSADYGFWQKAGSYPNAPATGSCSPITDPACLQAYNFWNW